MKQIKNPVGDGGDRIPRLTMVRDFGFLILDVVLDIGGVPHALGSVAAVFNGARKFASLTRAICPTNSDLSTEMFNRALKNTFFYAPVCKGTHWH